MGNNENYRLDLVPVMQIKRMPGLKLDASKKKVEMVREFSGKRGYCVPVFLSESEGCMTLLSNAAAFEACLEQKRARIPAVIVRTEGDADNLMFALQTAALNESPDALAVSAAIVQLIDIYGISRKHITETLGKSPAWVNRMENLSRKLNATVQMLVLQGHVPSRSAQEIARLPDDVQTAFAVSAGNEFLSKEDVTYLVNRYLNIDTGEEERSRIVNSPKLALPYERKTRSRHGKDSSDSARLSRAIARCLDDAAYLARLLDRVDMDVTAIRLSDVAALADGLQALNCQLQKLITPG